MIKNLICQLREKGLLIFRENVNLGQIRSSLIKTPQEDEVKLTTETMAAAS